MAKKKSDTVWVKMLKAQMVNVNGREIIFQPGEDKEVSTDTARLWTSRGYAVKIDSKD